MSQKPSGNKKSIDLIVNYSSQQNGQPSYIPAGVGVGDPDGEGLADGDALGEA